MAGLDGAESEGRTMRKLLMIGALGAGLAMAACTPVPPPREAPHNHIYYTEVHVTPGSVSGNYGFDTACVLRDGTTATHHDNVQHTTGSATITTFSWPQPYPTDCTVTETAGLPGPRPATGLAARLLLRSESPTVYVPITEPTTTPQTCHQTIIGTYAGTPPTDFWDCIFTVENT
jgi:hypothetical protein